MLEVAVGGGGPKLPLTSVGWQTSCCAVCMHVPGHVHHPLPWVTPSCPPTHPLCPLCPSSVRPQWERMMAGRSTAGTQHDPSSCSAACAQ